MVTLGQLRNLLAVADENAQVPYGFTYAHSWRGSYDEVSFKPAAQVTVKEMRAEVERAFTETFQGWKGGDYTYGKWTPVHIDEPGDCFDYDISPVITSIALAVAWDES